MASTASFTDSESIKNMSFVPNNHQRNVLYKTSIAAENEKKAGNRCTLLSKLHHLPGGIGLCPDSLDPNETVLAGMGAGREVQGAFWKPGKGGILNKKGLTTCEKLPLYFFSA